MHIIKYMKRIIFIFACSLFLLSCSKKSGQATFANKQLAEAAYEDSFVSMRASGIEGESPAVYSDSTSDFASAPVSQEIIERKLIRTGNISLEVASLEDGAAAIEAWVSKYNGYVSNSNQYTNSSHFVVRIPADKFDEAINSFAGIGKVKTRSIKAEDVTDSYYDLKTRLETKKLLREKYNQYLKKAENVKDLMEVERNLNDVISEIESMEGRLKLLTNQIDYSTISIYLETEKPVYSPSYSVHKIDFKQIGYNIINFIISLFKLVIYIIVYGIPVLALLFLLYWLCFGKIGLIRRLFKRLSKKSGKEKDKE